MLTQGQTVFIEGEKCNFVYVVFEGRFSMKKTIKTDGKDCRQADSSASPKKSQTQLKGKLERKDTMMSMRFKSIPQTEVVCVFETNTIIGESDVLNQRRHSSTLECSSATGILFAINKDQFIKIKES